MVVVNVLHKPTQASHVSSAMIRIGPIYLVRRLLDNGFSRYLSSLSKSQSLTDVEIVTGHYAAGIGGFRSDG
jgi:hypothetical protein